MEDADATASQFEETLSQSSLGNIMSALADLGPDQGIQRFAASLDPQWIEEALVATGSASIRRRKLPADQVVWLVLGMCMFADRSIVDMVDHLKLTAPGVKTLARSAVSGARARLGAEPLRWLFDKVSAHWESTPGLGGYKGMELYGIDGTHLRVQDSDANYKHFGKPGGRGGKGDAGYPQLRLVAVMNLSSRLLKSAEAGKWSEGEHTLVKPLTSTIPSNSVTIVDRGFYSYLWLHELMSQGENRHIMVRAKKSLTYDVIDILSDGTALARINRTPRIRREHPDAPESMIVRVIEYQHEGGDPSRLFVSLLDPDEYPAKELIELYHERWEIEIGFDELKTHMLERKECLRSKTPAGVIQELWGQLLTYNLVRREMLLAAQSHGVPPQRISFRSSLLWVRNFWVTAALTQSPANIPRHLGELRSTLDVLLLPARRSERRYPRHVKIKMSNYKRNRGKRGREGGSAGSRTMFRAK